MASADLSHRDVWSREIKNVGYCKAHHLWPLESAAPTSLFARPGLRQTLAGLICESAVKLSLSSAYGCGLTPTLGTSRPRLHEMPHVSTPGRRNDKHIVGIRFIQYVNGEARMGGGGRNDDGHQMFHSSVMFIDQNSDTGPRHGRWTCSLFALLTSSLFFMHSITMSRICCDWLLL